MWEAGPGGGLWPSPVRLLHEPCAPSSFNRALFKRRSNSRAPRPTLYSARSGVCVCVVASSPLLIPEHIITSEETRRPNFKLVLLNSFF